MKSDVIKISEAEWEVMRVVWAQTRTTSPEIISHLSETKEWKPATIKTLLGRLVKKGMLKTETQGNKFIYEALVTEEQTIRSATAELFSRICAKKVGKTIAEMIEEAELTRDDLVLIQQALIEKEKTAVETIACNCIPGQCDCPDHKN
ncbi:CopY/TcrY family copper transport repressor [Vagococcus sp. PNs007]|uniref:CopY/TcrY family copper transport repressor n=1 Tax=Vagococcus proximus TaxID=2991417 RepID=A0ABT5WYU3_9ENTE|nr:CopY/TcrY family copper transport repressor [Vagococcus proximus]